MLRAEEAEEKRDEAVMSGTQAAPSPCGMLASQPVTPACLPSLLAARHNKQPHQADWQVALSLRRGAASDADFSTPSTVYHHLN